MRLIAAVFLLVISCTSSGAQEWRNWQSEHYREHPLVGLIHIPASNKPLDRKPETQAFRLNLLRIWAWRVRFLLIGEQHDNPDHHRIQAWFLNEIAKIKRRPAVVLEMVPRTYSDHVMQFDLGTDPQLDQFAKRVDWEKRGWPAWEIYRPVGLAAARNNMRLVAGNLDRKTTRKMSKEGFHSLSGLEIKAFGLESDLSEPLRVSLDAELRASHCNLLPETMIPAMRNIQRARDGALADAMITSGDKAGAVLITGNGHVRKDRGVPLILRYRLPGFTEQKPSQQGGMSISVRIPNAHLLAVGLIEVQEGLNNPADYNLINEQGEPLYDAVIFTPKANITDRCAALRKQFEKKKSE